MHSIKLHVLNEVWAHSQWCGHTPSGVGTLPVVWVHSQWCGHAPSGVGTLPVVWAHSQWCGYAPSDVGTLPVVLNVLWLYRVCVQKGHGSLRPNTACSIPAFVQYQPSFDTSLYYDFLMNVCLWLTSEHLG